MEVLGGGSVSPVPTGLNLDCFDLFSCFIIHSRPHFSTRRNNHGGCEVKYISIRSGGGDNVLLALPTLNVRSVHAASSLGVALDKRTSKTESVNLPSTGRADELCLNDPNQNAS